MIYFIIVCFVLIMMIIIYYNIMLRKTNNVKNAFASLDVMFKRRRDLVPNLVEIVKGYSIHEKEVLNGIINLRSTLNNDETHLFSLNNELSNYLSKLFVISEGYPELKSNTNYLNLQKTLYDIEELISAGRRTYNAHVTDYNNFISIFPNLLFAKMLGFKKYDLFKASVDERKSLSL